MKRMTVSTVSPEKHLQLRSGVAIRMLVQAHTTTTMIETMVMIP